MKYMGEMEAMSITRKEEFCVENCGHYWRRKKYIGGKGLELHGYVKVIATLDIFIHVPFREKKTNTIVGTRDVHNVWQREEMAIANVVDHYFHGIYSTTHPPAIDEVFRK